MQIKQSVAALATLLAASTSLAFASDSSQSFPAPASDRNTWFQAGQSAIAAAKDLRHNNRKAKNVILFIGDGMGISTVTAARILAGQQPNIIGSNPAGVQSSGEENSLSFEKLSYLALSKTYSVNQQTSDSAPTMTAMVTGVKTNDGELSVDEATARKDCGVDLATHQLPTILELAEDAGKSTGLVSTARITHATPAANYAHTTERDWEADSSQPAGCGVPDIARQLLENPHGDGLEVALGGGRTYFMPKTDATGADVLDPEYSTVKGRRNDGRDLTKEWQQKYGDKAYAWNKAQFDAVNPRTAQRLLGLFQPSHMQYEADRASDAGGEPSLADMTEKAIKILRKNPKGFYLHVEAGRIDHGHHAGNAYRALTDTIALSDAVQRAVEVLQASGQLRDTLIVVSADHSHTFTIGGYPQRGNNILGRVVEPGKTTPTSAFDGLPYTTLAYGNGQGSWAGVGTDALGNELVYNPALYPPHSGRNAALDMASVDTTDKDFHQETAVALTAETHAGEDVGIFAMGPKAHLFHGVMEQNVIFHVMKDAFQF
jgi:alkaline phosphatase